MAQNLNIAAEKKMKSESLWTISFRRLRKSRTAVLGIIIIILFTSEFLSLFSYDKSYNQAFEFLPLLVLVFFIQSFYYIISKPLFWLKKTRKIFMIVCLLLILSVALSAALLKYSTLNAMILSKIFVFMILNLAFYFSTPKEYRQTILSVEFILNQVLGKIFPFVFGVFEIYLLFKFNA